MIRDVHYKLRVLRNGALYREAEFPASSPPVITAKRTSEIKSALTGTIAKDENINILTDRLQAVAVIDGVEKPLGVFCLTTKTDKHDGIRELWEVQAYDQCWLCYMQTTESLLHLSAGTGYLSVIEQLLTACGITNVISDDSAAVLDTDREDWQIGTRYLTIINTLLAEINFLPLWFDADGFAHLTRYTAPGTGTPARIYSSNDIRRVGMAPGYSRSSDVFSAPNVFIAICDNADKDAVLVARAENDSFGERSILRRGIRIPQTVKVNNIADQESLQAYADKLRDDSLFSTETVVISVPCDGGRRLGDIIAIDDDSIGGIYREEGWRLSLKEGSLIELTLTRSTM